MVSNEAISWLKKKKEHGALLKLDLNKAYDSVHWCFLEQVMHGMGFGDKWIIWIMSCVSTASISVLVNGSPLEPTLMEKGLRQGVTIFPYMFILVKL